VIVNNLFYLTIKIKNKNQKGEKSNENKM